MSDRHENVEGVCRLILCAIFLDTVIQHGGAALYWQVVQNHFSAAVLVAEINEISVSATV